MAMARCMWFLRDKKSPLRWTAVVKWYMYQAAFQILPMPQRFVTALLSCGGLTDGIVKACAGGLHVLATHLPIERPGSATGSRLAMWEALGRTPYAASRR